MRKFEVIDISGDAGIRAYGESLEELFVNAAIGMYSLITDPEGIEEKRQISVEVESYSTEGLLVAWLNELIFHFDTYGFLGKRIIIAEMTPSLSLSPGGIGVGERETCSLRAVIAGEDFDEERHEKRLIIKAATYHMLKIEREDNAWTVGVIFDI